MDIQSYLEDHYQFDVAGSEAKISGTCPFCQTSRSDLRLYINLDTGVGFCHHCNTGFSLAKFVSATEGVTIRQAKDIINGRESTYVRTKDKHEDSPSVFYPIIDPISEWPEAQKYVDERGITKEAIDHFDLKYAYAHQKNNGKSIWCGRRIIIPIKDTYGRVVSWQGRAIDKKASNKYIFTPGFSKANYLFNAQAIAAGCDMLIVTEGVFGAIGWWQGGFPNVVASFGKHISGTQLGMLLKIAPRNLYIELDNDAIWQAYTFVERHGHLFNNIQIVNLGEKDADDMGSDELQQAIIAARPYNWSEKILSMRIHHTANSSNAF